MCFYSSGSGFQLPLAMGNLHSESALCPSVSVWSFFSHVARILSNTQANCDELLILELGKYY